MDRLAALVVLRWKTDLRALLGARERLYALLVTLPFGLLFSLLGAALAYFVVRAVDARHPDALPGLVSVAATFMGLLWALSPLISGVTLSEAHDLTRLVHFPVAPRVMVLASLLANFTQPMVLGQVPLCVAVAWAVSGHAAFAPLALVGVLLSLAFIVAASQAAGLALHGLSRNRRLHDVALFAGLSLTFLISIGPFLLLAGAGSALGGVVKVVFAGALPALSPFGWGARAAVHAGRAELGGFALFAAASVVATAALVVASGWLAGRIYQGDVDVGTTGAARGRRARTWLPGRLGALVEKDLRVMWREPALKALLVIGLAAPLVFIFFITRLPGGRPPAATWLLLASFVGLGGLGSNAFGIERRAIARLFGFPVARWRILVAKNLAVMAFRLPGLVALGLATLLLAPTRLLPAAAAIVFATLLIATGVDNYLSILFPVALPAPGRNPYGASSAGGGRGLLGVLLNLAALVVVLAVSAPFVFLLWLPLLANAPAWWVFCLPMGVLGAVAVYAMLVAGAAGLLERREPDILERILGEV